MGEAPHLAPHAPAAPARPRPLLAAHGVLLGTCSVRERAWHAYSKACARTRARACAGLNARSGPGFRELGDAIPHRAAHRTEPPHAHLSPASCAHGTARAHAREKTCPGRASHWARFTTGCQHARARTRTRTRTRGQPGQLCARAWASACTRALNARRPCKVVGELRDDEDGPEHLALREALVELLLLRRLGAGRIRNEEAAPARGPRLEIAAPRTRRRRPHGPVAHREALRPHRRRAGARRRERRRGEQRERARQRERGRRRTALRRWPWPRLEPRWRGRRGCLRRPARPRGRGSAAAAISAVHHFSVHETFGPRNTRNAEAENRAQRKSS